MAVVRTRYAVYTLTLLFAGIAILRIIACGLDHGDEYSDADAMSAGKNFVKFGFIASRFLPEYEPHLDKPQKPYTHAPPLSDVLNGVQRAVFKTDVLYPYRAVALLLSWISVILWFFLIKRITGSDLFAFLAALFYTANPYFIYGMDALREIAYADFLRNLILFNFVSLAEKRFRSAWQTALIAVLVILESLVTFEYVFYLTLFFILYSVYCVRARQRYVTIRILVPLILAPAAGFLLHLAQNVWYFGGLAPAVLDLRNIFLQRVLNSADSFAALSLPVWLNLVIVRNFSLVLLFSWFSILLILAAGYLLYTALDVQAKRLIRASFRAMIVLIACGISWYVLFPSHSLAHTYVNFLARHLTPVASIFFASFCMIIIMYIRGIGTRSLWIKSIPAVICMIVCFTGLGQSQLPFTPQRMAVHGDFARFEACLKQLKNASRPDDLVGINYFRFPPVRYYGDRRIRVIFDRQSLISQEILPEYFIFIPYNNNQAQELFQALNESYDIIFKCRSERFPALFFRKKL